MHDRVANLLGATALNVTNLALSQMRHVADLGESASAALITLVEHPGLSVTGLGGRIGLSQPAAARMVDGLVARGFVTRQPGSGRTVELQLTRSGRRTAAKLLVARSEALGELIKDLDANELETLAR
ncbi:MAG TPA: MarR family transcriptional regulator, partial [Actinomycetota bacterium]|nr:MarR family transcriptional regulator [Actinomycetota bacterium]